MGSLFVFAVVCIPTPEHGKGIMFSLWERRPADICALHGSISRRDAAPT